MGNIEELQINQCLRDIFNEDMEVRVEAINRLGEIGDELCLKELRTQLKLINNEHQALIMAIGKLKQRLGVK
jgi:hypothetical protein